MEAEARPVSLHGVFWADANQLDGLRGAAKGWFGAMVRVPCYQGFQSLRPRRLNEFLPLLLFWSDFGRKSCKIGVP